MEPLKGKKNQEPMYFGTCKLFEFRMCYIAVSYLMEKINLCSKDYLSICGKFCVQHTKVNAALDVFLICSIDKMQKFLQRSRAAGLFWKS